MANKPITPSGSCASKYDTEKWVKTGAKWIDGKLIYRRCFTGSTQTGNYPITIPNSSGIDKIINCGGYFYSINDRLYYPVNYTLIAATATTSMTIYYDPNSGIVPRAMRNGNPTSTTFEIWVEATLNN